MAHDIFANAELPSHTGRITESLTDGINSVHNVPGVHLGGGAGSIKSNSRGLQRIEM